MGVWKVTPWTVLKRTFNHQRRSRQVLPLCKRGFLSRKNHHCSNEDSPNILHIGDRHGPHNPRNVFSVIGTMFQIRSCNYVKEFLWQIYVTNPTPTPHWAPNLLCAAFAAPPRCLPSRLLPKTKISSFSSVSILPEAIFGLSVLFLLIFLTF